MGQLSVSDIGDGLRRAIGLLPFAQAQQAIDLLEEAVAIVVYVGQGSAASEFEQVLAYFTQAKQQLTAAVQALHTAQTTTERFIANIGATETAGGRGTASPAVSATHRREGSQTDGGVRHDGHRVLVGEVQRQGHKISADKVVRIGRDRDGRVVWLETGDESRGMRHILEPTRLANFVGIGIGQDDIVDVVFRAATSGTPVGLIGKDRPVFAIDYQGQTKHIAVTVASNGFIVGANPISPSRKLRPLS